MQNFVYNLHTKMIFGCGELKRVGVETRDLGRRAILVTGKSSMRRLGILDRVVENLTQAGVETIVFEGMEPNPRCTTIDEAAAVARAGRCDVIVALGGGSALDAAKGVAVSAVTGRPVWDYIYSGDDREILPHHIALPIVAVPTLAAAGSEFGAGAVITNWETREKAILAGDHLFPRVSIVDPELMVSVPMDITGDGGVDIISHAFDNYISNTESTPLQDRFSEGVMRTVIDYLGRAMRDGNDIEARTQLAWASVIANSGVVHNGRNGAGPMHFIEHTLGGIFDISHGRGLVILMPHMFRFNNAHTSEKYAQIGKNVFFITDPSLSDYERGEKAIECLVDWLKEIGMYTRLCDVGIREDSFERVANETIRVYEALGGGDGAIRNPARRLDKQGIIEVLRMAS